MLVTGPNVCNTLLSKSNLEEIWLKAERRRYLNIIMVMAQDNCGTVKKQIVTETELRLEQ